MTQIQKSNELKFEINLNENIQNYLQQQHSNIKVNYITKEDEILLLDIIDDLKQMQQLESVLKFQSRIMHHKWVTMIYMYYIKYLENNHISIIHSLNINDELFQLLSHQLNGRDFNKDLLYFIHHQDLSKYSLHQWINPLTLEGCLIIQWLLVQDLEINHEISHFVYEHITRQFNSPYESVHDWIDFLGDLYHRYGEFDYWTVFFDDYLFSSKEELIKQDLIAQRYLIRQPHYKLMPILVRYIDEQMLQGYLLKLKEKFVIAYKQAPLIQQLYLAWLVSADFQEAAKQNCLSSLLFIDQFEQETSTSLLFDILMTQSYDWTCYIKKTIPELIEIGQKTSMVSVLVFLMHTVNEVKVESFIKQWLYYEKLKIKDLRHNETKSLKKKNIITYSLEELLERDDNEMSHYIDDVYSQLSFDFTNEHQKQDKRFIEFSEYCQKVKTNVETIDHSDLSSVEKLEKISEIYNEVVASQQTYSDIEVYDSIVRNVQKYIILYESIVEKEVENEIKPVFTLTTPLQISDDEKIDLRLKGEYLILIQMILRDFRKKLAAYLQSFQNQMQLMEYIFKSQSDYESMQETLDLYLSSHHEIVDFNELIEQIPFPFLMQLMSSLKDEMKNSLTLNYYNDNDGNKLMNMLKVLLDFKEWCLSDCLLSDFSFSKYHYLNLFEYTKCMISYINDEEMIDDFIGQLFFVFKKVKDRSFKENLGFKKGWQEAL